MEVSIKQSLAKYQEDPIKQGLESIAYKKEKGKLNESTIYYYYLEESAQDIKGDIPKQYTKKKDDISILFMSVKPFVNVGFKKAFIVCDPSWEKFIKEELNLFDIELFFAKNGKDRQDSIDHGIHLIFKTQDINEEDVVVVQEAVWSICF